jgi:hypothetical protein
MITNYVIAVAHLDDIEFGLYKYIKNLIRNKSKDSPKKLNFYIFIASSGLYKHSTSISHQRQVQQIINIKNIFSYESASTKSTFRTGTFESFYNNNQAYNKITIEINPDPVDTLFFENKKTIRSRLENFIESFKKDVKIIKELDNDITENILISMLPDIHEDHKIISELCDVVARPIFNILLSGVPETSSNSINTSIDSIRSTFTKYLKFVIPINNIYCNYNLGPDEPKSNRYLEHNRITINEDDVNTKELLLSKYPKETLNFEREHLYLNEQVYRIY